MAAHDTGMGSVFTSIRLRLGRAGVENGDLRGFIVAHRSPRYRTRHALDSRGCEVERGIGEGRRFVFAANSGERSVHYPSSDV